MPSPKTQQITNNLAKLSRYAPGSWGQMLKIEKGDVWDEEPQHCYFREVDVIKFLREHNVAD
jgi:hypothetical protein